MKKTLCLLIVICSLIPLTVFSQGEYLNFYVKISVDGENVTVSVEYDNAHKMCGGSFDFIYDSSVLIFSSYEDGEAVSRSAHFVNEKYGDDRIRVNWASATALDESGSIVIFVFKLSNGVFNDASVQLGSLKVSDENGEKLQTEINYSFPEAALPDEEKNVNVPTGGDGISHSGGGGGSSGIKSEYNATADNNEPGDMPDADDKASQEVFQFDFTDVSENDWFYNDVLFAFSNGLMMGVGDNIFAPDEAVTRAMLVTILYRLENQPEIAEVSAFGDVEENSWYSEAVAWASANGIVHGYSDARFGPNDSVTREQTAAIIYRYAELKQLDMSVENEEILISYSDYKKISEYSVAAMCWIRNKGIMTGDSDTTINPKGISTRAQISAVLKRFSGMINAV